MAKSKNKNLAFWQVLLKIIDLEKINEFRETINIPRGGFKNKEKRMAWQGNAIDKSSHENFMTENPFGKLLTYAQKTLSDIPDERFKGFQNSLMEFILLGTNAVNEIGRANVTACEIIKVLGIDDYGYKKSITEKGIYLKISNYSTVADIFSFITNKENTKLLRSTQASFRQMLSLEKPKKINTKLYFDRDRRIKELNGYEKKELKEFITNHQSFSDFSRTIPLSNDRIILIVYLLRLEGFKVTDSTVRKVISRK